MQIIYPNRLEWLRPLPSPVKLSVAEKACRLVGGRLPSLMDMEAKLMGRDDPSDGIYWVAQPARPGGHRAGNLVVWNYRAGRSGAVPTEWAAGVRCVRGVR